MLPLKLQETLDDLSMLSDRQERIDYLISIAQGFENPDPDVVPRCQATRVPGCESEAYVVATRHGEGVKLWIAVDNPQGISAMALAVILDQSLSGEDADAIQDVPEEIVFRIFGTELSMGKSMGLTGMVRMAKAETARVAKG